MDQVAADNAFIVPQQAVTRGAKDTVMIVNAQGGITPRGNGRATAGYELDCYVGSEGRGQGGCGRHQYRRYDGGEKGNA